MQLYLANKKISVIENLPMSKTLETLWVNGNKLEQITGIEHFTTLKCVFAHNNHLTTVRGSLKHLRFLRVLSLYNNQLSDLEATLPYLAHLQHLEQLDLFGNPLANETNYRLRVIRHIPSLHVLDRHEVTETERERAKKLFSSAKTDEGVHIAFGERVKPWVPPPKSGMRTCTEEMEQEVERIKLRRERDRDRDEMALYGGTTAGKASNSEVSTATLSSTLPIVTRRPRADFLKMMHYEHRLVPSQQDIEEATALALKSAYPSNKTSRAASRRASLATEENIGGLSQSSVLSKARNSLAMSVPKIRLDMKMQEEYRLRQRLAAKVNKLVPIEINA